MKSPQVRKYLTGGFRENGISARKLPRTGDARRARLAAVLKERWTARLSPAVAALSADLGHHHYKTGLR